MQEKEIIKSRPQKEMKIPSPEPEIEEQETEMVEEEEIEESNDVPPLENFEESQIEQFERDDGTTDKSGT